MIYPRDNIFVYHGFASKRRRRDFLLPRLLASIRSRLNGKHLKIISLFEQVSFSFKRNKIRAISESNVKSSKKSFIGWKVGRRRSSWGTKRFNKKLLYVFRVT